MGERNVEVREIVEPAAAVPAYSVGYFSYLHCTTFTSIHILKNSRIFGETGLYAIPTGGPTPPLPENPKTPKF